MLSIVFDKLATDPDMEGTGLGLAIVKQIVEAHGGAASAESAHGAGATFTFTIPPPAGVDPSLNPKSVCRSGTGGVRHRFFFLQGEDLLGSGGAIWVMLMHRILELFVNFLHMLFVFLLVQLVLVLR